jgi:uncharacterized membrane protein (DUF373 family)
MDRGLRTDLIIARVEGAIVSALQLLLIFSVIVATIVLFFLFAKNLVVETAHITSVGELLPSMQRSFSGILIVMLGLELLETLKTYFTEHQIRVEVILVVAIIAIGRQVIQVDFDHTSGIVDLGLASLIAALSVGYCMVKKAQAASEERSVEKPGGGGK